ncbi:hypothetical protein [Kitasatospora cheerisanensis]|uniref:Secreted protein n=1 Tax=Kitasatospora cheerisanensis KCTC 2395 TaxID=1348663 RepID=A0A066Z5A7_9ACTN|nr:hypothetical protein [Kitasatospora cheerisanensis]KDN87434.1 hypothetical protein KCH_08060 [Kitasatospora cheerisanensis KCTC 2395]
MYSRLKRATSAVAVALVASAAALTVGTGTATAAPSAAATTINELYFSYTQAATAWNQCQLGIVHFNNVYYGNPNGGNDEYFYCAPGANGAWNLWWRHNV